MNFSERNIYLIGFMGSGKSTLGPILAKRLKKSFFDTDHWVEQEVGKSIQEIFAENGERYFRDCESNAVNHAVGMNNLVVALGGGSVMRMDNWIQIKNSGITIYLKCSADEIWRRLKDTPETRPLIMGNNMLKKENIKILLSEREPMYAQADIIFDIENDQSIDYTVNKILEKLEAQREDCPREAW